MKISKKLFIIALIPIVVLSILIARTVLSKFDSYTETKNIIDLINLSVKMGNLIHELQKERGMSSGFISSKGEKFKEAILKQRSENTNPKTDDLKISLKLIDNSVLDKFSKKIIDDINNSLNNIETIRTKVNNFEISVSDAISFYTKLNENLINFIQHSTKLTTCTTIIKYIVTYYNLINYKEFAGIERATVTNIFNTNKFTDNFYEKFINIITQEFIYENEFKKYATEKQLEQYNQFIQDKSFEEVENYRKILKEKHLNGEFAVNSEVWFDTISKKTVKLKEFEDILANDLLEFSKSKKDSEFDEITGYILRFSIAIILTIFLTFFVAFNIISTINKTTNILKDISEGEGDLTIKLPEKEKGDELNELSHWFNIFVEKIRNIIEEMSNQSTVLATSSEELSISSKEMTKQIKVTESETKESSVLITNANIMGKNITHTIDENAKDIENTILLNKEIKIYFNEIEKTAESLNDMIASVSSAVEEINATINEVSKNTVIAAQTSQKTAKQTSESESIIHKLNESSNQIGEIVNLIKDIAEQTNLLALNATIEAARAGEAGKGFAVVANEIKNLAKQTSDATQSITQQIKSIQQNTAETSESIKSITIQIYNLNEVTNSIASAIEEQSATVSEISKDMNNTNNMTQKTILNIENISGKLNISFKNMENTGKGMNSVLKNISQISESLESINLKSTNISEITIDSSSSANQVSALSNDLSVLSVKLKTIVDKFKI